MTGRTRPEGSTGDAPAGYADLLRHQFPQLNPVVDDLFLLEAHQIAALPQRAPRRELAAILHADGRLARFLIARCAGIAEFLDRLLADHPPAAPDELAACEQAVVWELADWIVYQRDPELYEEGSGVAFELEAVTDIVALEGKVVLDVGAGTGRVALAVAPVARHVFAVEPVAALRSFIRDKAAGDEIENVFVLDGFLDAIPLPAETADVLLTCQAIGWSLSAELREIERVVKPGGIAQHLFGAATVVPDSPLLTALTADGYQMAVHERPPPLVRSYWKQFGAVGRTSDR